MKNMTLNLKIWRQENTQSKGKLVTYKMEDVSPDMSFLEMLDVLNENLIVKGDNPIEFDSDCREGICGTCGLVINGVAHGVRGATTTCELHMREYKDGDTIIVEPFRAKSFPVVKDLMVDRSAFDRIIAAGGYVNMSTGNAPEANSVPIPKVKADEAFDAATCVGYGACVASCPNASATLFTAAKISQFALLPQGHPERKERAMNMVEQMDKEGFGDCSNHAECEAACPKEISISHIARMKREYFKAALTTKI